ncbi:MAG TPA: hypothetical protein PKK96_14530 [Anaerolineales bacterium]|nr:hypothetical protein [Anaerolineales bacterium]HNS62217.1 hypothetical protein [Anaerolineales bacterium]
MQFLKTRKIVANHWVAILILSILATGIWFRATSYGDLRLSAGMSDTPSYINSSRANLFSPQMFSGERLFTTNLLYKLANDPNRCPLTVIGNPSVGVELPRALQPCFDKIAVLQNILSIIGWAFLAATVARWLFHPLYKILAILLVLAFGFTPQIAEWDSVLSSESISLSMFAIVTGLTLEIAQRIAKDRNQQSSAATRSLTAIWLVIFLLWVFLRDVHLYACLITVALLFPFVVVKKLRISSSIPILAYVLSGVFILGMYTTQKSPRWELPLFHVMDGRVFTDQGMTDYFATHFDMPRDPSSPEYEKWFNSRGFRSYGIFLATHPRYMLSALMERSDYLSEGFIQPYFTTAEIRSRKTLLEMGRIVHPESNAVFLVDLILAASMLITSLKYPADKLWAWTWLTAWMFFFGSASVLLSFFGDNIGIHRHIFPYVEIFRLLLWIGLLANMDSLVRGPESITIQSKE